MENRELKPCPFCGRKVSMTYCGADNTYNVYHKGEACAMFEPMLIDGYLCKSYEDAAEAWNRRV